MKIFQFAFLFLLFGSSVLSVTAQKKAPPKTVKYAVKFKAPKLITLLGNFKDSVSINAGDAENIIGLPLRIVDDKKNVYTISSYQFLYKKNVVTEDEVSGKVLPTTSIVSDRFRSTPLPDVWVTKVREQLRAKDFLYFFDIIVKDAQGRVMYAPEVKITVL